jgi:hypothetical protein
VIFCSQREKVQKRSRWLPIPICNARFCGNVPFFETLLDMSFNKLRGSIEMQLDGMVSLKFLNLSSNQFSGNLPTNLGRSMVLEHLCFQTIFFKELCLIKF